MAGIRWDEEEIKIIRDSYSLINIQISKNEFCKKLPNRTWNSIILKAKQLGVSMLYPAGAPKGNVYKLLEETVEAYYWAGFIAADGSIADNKRLHIKISTKDSDHLLKFAQFISCDNVNYGMTDGFPYIYVSIQDPHVIPEFCKKFGFYKNKTQNPPNLSYLSGDKLLSFIAGFIDGDGCIRHQTGRSDCVLTIKNHKSWLPVLRMFEVEIYKELGISPYRAIIRSRINNRGYSVLNISDNSVLRALKGKLIALGLHIMKRKWGKINDGGTSRYAKSGDLKRQIKDLAKGGLSQIKISKFLGISSGYVSRIINSPTKGDL